MSIQCLLNDTVFKMTKLKKNPKLNKTTKQYQKYKTKNHIRCKQIYHLLLFGSFFLLSLLFLFVVVVVAIVVAKYAYIYVLITNTTKKKQKLKKPQINQHA